MCCDIDEFCCSPSITAFKTINTKHRYFQNIQALLFIIDAFGSRRIPSKISHDNNCDDKIKVGGAGCVVRTDGWIVTNSILKMNIMIVRSPLMIVKDYFHQGINVHQCGK